MPVRQIHLQHTQPEEAIVKHKLYAVDLGERRYYVVALTKKGAIAFVVGAQVQATELSAVETMRLPSDQEILDATALS